MLWLLNVCDWTYPGRVDPFTMVNTGDWNGEISQMLAKPNGNGVIDESDRPNRSVEELKASIENWLSSKK